MELPTELPTALPTAAGTAWGNGTAWASLPGHEVNETGPPRGKNTASILIAIVITALYSVVCVVGLLGNVLVMYGIVSEGVLGAQTHQPHLSAPSRLFRSSASLPSQGARSIALGWAAWGAPSAERPLRFAAGMNLGPGAPASFAALGWSPGRTPPGALTLGLVTFSSHFTSPSLISPIDGKVLCTLQFPDPPIYWDTVTKICVFIFAFMVPILVITICYGLMILRLKSVRLLSGSKEKDRNLRRITRMVLVVVAAFIICWTPIHIFVIVWTLVDIDKKNPYVVASLHFCIALGYTNSSLNPVLYAFLDENFKRCFREFCLPFRARVDQNSFSRARNATREHVSTCTPSETRTKPA
ncbi:OPRD protein, partial [Columbina picui]|nr:OPRD protein [Columbina picui]